MVSGDCLVVKDSASGMERRVNLSSLRTPRMGRKGERPETYATEAKEFLRQRLIGELQGLGRYGQLWSDHDTGDTARILTLQQCFMADKLLRSMHEAQAM